MSLNHLVERLSVKRDYVPPIGFVDDFFDVEAHHNLQRSTQSQIGIEIKPNTIEKQKIRTARWRSKKPQSPRLWREKNREKIRVHSKKYRQSEKFKLSIKKWRENNRHKYNAYQLEWLNKHREEVRRKQRDRKAERYHNDPAYKQKKLEINRRVYRKWKERKIEELGLEAFKEMQRQKNLKQKEKKQNEQRI